MIDPERGFVYNTRNSNNPAQAKAYGSVDISGMAIYKFRIGNHPLVARYQANLPLLLVSHVLLNSDSHTTKCFPWDTKERTCYFRFTTTRRSDRC